jgi:hypothetical protein
MASSSHAPMQFPVGTKYIVESCGPFVRRHIEFPNGHRIQLTARKAVSCTCQRRQCNSIAPDQNADLVEPGQRILAQNEIASVR